MGIALEDVKSAYNRGRLEVLKGIMLLPADKEKKVIKQDDLFELYEEQCKDIEKTEGKKYK